MVLFVSGRCDVIAFYSEWFKKRYEEGFVHVRNPFNPKLVSQINFSDVDLIMFCTKKPNNIVDYLDKIKQPILFHVTITPYKEDIEPGVTDKKEVIESVKKISKIIGKDNVFVRYDPIFISDKYNLEYHIKAFSKLCSELKGYVETFIISFMDEYKNVKTNKDILKYREITPLEFETMAKKFNEIASLNGIAVQTCAENLEEYGFKKGECLSKELAFKLTGKKEKKWSSRDCGCVQLVDIGVYNSCKNFCRYCYANYDEKEVNKNFSMHDVNSTFLIGNLKNDDIIKVRSK